MNLKVERINNIDLQLLEDFKFSQNNNKKEIKKNNVISEESFNELFHNELDKLEKEDNP